MDVYLLIVPAGNRSLSKSWSQCEVRLLNEEPVDANYWWHHLVYMCEINLEDVGPTASEALSDPQAYGERLKEVVPLPDVNLSRIACYYHVHTGDDSE